MKNFIIKVKAFFKLITPWIKFGITEFNNVKKEIELSIKDKELGL